MIESDGFKTLKDGEEVDYELKEGDKGLHAARVVRINAPLRPTKSSDGTSTDQLNLNGGMIAPKLETGTVPLTSRTSADMVEVETVEAAGEDDSLYESDNSSLAAQGKSIS